MSNIREIIRFLLLSLNLVHFGVPLQKSLTVKFLIALVAWKAEVGMVSVEVVQEDLAIGEDHF